MFYAPSFFFINICYEYFTIIGIRSCFIDDVVLDLSHLNLITVVINIVGYIKIFTKILICLVLRYN